MSERGQYRGRGGRGRGRGREQYQEDDYGPPGYPQAHPRQQSQRQAPPMVAHQPMPRREGPPPPGAPAPWGAPQAPTGYPQGAPPQPAPQPAAQQLASQMGRMTMAQQPVGAAPAGPSQPIERGPELQVAIPDRPLRPKVPGKAGRTIKVLANFFHLDVTADELYQYAVHITKIAAPETEGEGSTAGRRPRQASGPLPSLLCRAAMLQFASDCAWRPGSWAFDGRANVYTGNVAMVPGDSLERQVAANLPGEERPVHFTVRVERSDILPLSMLNAFFNNRETTAPHHVLQALDVILKHRMGMLTLTKPNIMAQGRSFLSWDSTNRSIGGGAEVWLGYKQSVRPCQTGLALTVDTAAGAVWDVGTPTNPVTLPEFIRKIAGNAGPRGFSPQQMRTIERTLRGMKIRATHNGFKRTIVGFARTTPFTEKFTPATGREVTVAQYFKDQYQVNITDRVLPLVRVGNGKVLLPAEVCQVLPKQRVDKLTPDMTAGMIKHAAQKPSDKLNTLKQKVREVIKEASAELNSFGIKIKAELATVNGRILPNPMLAYGGKPSYDPSNIGAWNLKDVKFLRGAKVESWAVVSFTDNKYERQGLPAFLPEFIKGLGKCGVMLAPSPPLVNARPSDPVGAVLAQAANHAVTKFNKRPGFMLVILPDTGTQLYKEIKQVGDSSLGVITQCIVAKKAGIGQREPRGQMQYIANVAMKVNAKVGGANTALATSAISTLPPFLKEFSKKPYMILGADVTHPAPGSQSPSVAAVVASLDAYSSRYATRISAQPTRPSERKAIEEIIQDLRGMVRELLMEFYRANNGKKPEAIVFYRDGVSEGQFDHVSKYEYTAIRQACADVAPGAEYAPPITLVVVQKRHQTRLFAADPRDTDRSGNLRPGVVVDTSICHPHEFDFYLNAHSGLQGTNRPVHYHCLVDQNGFGVDSLQHFSYWLCYLFCRCTRSISVVPAARYAHLAAFRARVLMKGGDSDAESMSSGVSGAGEMMGVNNALKQAMFFV